MCIIILQERGIRSDSTIYCWLLYGHKYCSLSPRQHSLDLHPWNARLRFHPVIASGWILAWICLPLIQSPENWKKKKDCQASIWHLFAKKRGKAKLTPILKGGELDAHSSTRPKQSWNPSCCITLLRHIQIRAYPRPSLSSVWKRVLKGHVTLWAAIIIQSSHPHCQHLWWFTFLRNFPSVVTLHSSNLHMPMATLSTPLQTFLSLERG